jgi:hypothetical protein
MRRTIKADASPEKQLFVSMITRDISLIAAFLDLIDNSINSAVEPSADQLVTASDYHSFLQDSERVPSVDIRIKVTDALVEVADTASGISFHTAAERVFRFGRSGEESQEKDRLSVYGIGLKRAIFKLGNKITMRSDHVDGGFDMDLDVEEWLSDNSLPWNFVIAERRPAQPDATGTTISVSDLHAETIQRLADGVFATQLRDAVARTYPFYLAKFVNIYVNDAKIEGTTIEIGSNHASESFVAGEVTCSITAGIGVPQGGYFRDKASGWFVFCNGRTVISADKSALTGWGRSPLPIFQPKHRPFVGTVFFVSRSAEKLPWNTTKSAIDEDSAVWQEARRHMDTVARVVINFLDSRYTDEGTEIASTDLQDAAGRSVSVISAATSERQVFVPPKRPPPENMRIQYDAKIADVKRIEKYLGRPGMGGAEVGRHTFYHFLRNQVGDK